MTEIHTIQIYDSAGTVDLSDGTNTRFIQYTPLVSSGVAPIRESLSVHFLTAGTATNLTAVQSLNKLFRKAREENENDTGANRVYAQLDLGKTGTLYRSRIYDGEVNLRLETLEYHYIRGKFILDIEWTRDPFWEGTLTQLPLTNSSGTLDTSGLTVTNAYDSSGDNWVQVAGTSVIGDMAAPIKIEMLNAYSSAVAANEIFIHHNVYSTPASLDTILEGENATGGTLTATAEGTPGASEGSYAAIQWAGTTETKIATWALSTAALGYMAGGRFAIIARWNVAFPYPNDLWLRLNLESASNVRETGTLVPITDARELHWLNTLRIASPVTSQGSVAGYNLCLYAQRGTTAGTHTLNLDYLQLSPVSSENGWLRFVGFDGSVPYNGYFYHDATEGYNYAVGTAGLINDGFTPYGGPIELIPGENQRLYFLTCDASGSALVEQSWTVKLWYRPRKHAL